MKSARITFVLLTFFLLSLVACSGQQTPTEVPTAVQVNSLNHAVTTTSTDFPAILINNVWVQFDGRLVDASGTTFSYTLTATGIGSDPTHFTVQIPECTDDPVAYTPTNSVSINYDPTTQLYGIDWHLNFDSSNLIPLHYTVTFPGDVPLGEVSGAIRSGDERTVATIPGPCAGYDISGKVFTDANQNALLDLDESGISNVVVELVDSEGRVQTTTTDFSGAYVFRKAAGSYTVRIPTDASAYPGSFNGQLAESFDPTTALSFDATVPPESTGNDFGFHPQTQELIYNLESGALLSDGESVKYWKKVLQGALNNSHPPGGYDPETVVGFVEQVRGLFLPDPYNFADGFDGVQQAFNILKNHYKDEVFILYQELLATELNEVAGRGLISQPGLQLALISWGESLIDQAWQSAQTAQGGAIVPYGVASGNLSDAITLFQLMNTGGGGSVDE
ncbi:MAG TPA: SdrD B-like domain-containing protein [Candidatus Krumholzibacteria bacterium]|nr:SdrD B-like domain-containing protein [Candidatus Krumholzibacteria bacterium]